ncbi:hypothetical protein HMPREF1551_00176 [Capnocytophaga sp. oral taxon 863 str. F0517]|nr:hypothetical protein HMPREF1551_00176 [Capnocytophaga sp. oral taxon 863 str. F0517]
MYIFVIVIVVSLLVYILPFFLIKEEKGEVWLYKYMCFIISSHVIFFILGTWIIENFFLLKENQIGYVILFFLFSFLPCLNCLYTGNIFGLSIYKKGKISFL